MPATSRSRKRHNPRKRPASSRYKVDLTSNTQKKTAPEPPASKSAKKSKTPVVYPMNFARPLRRLYAFLIDVGLIFLMIYTIAPVSGDALFSKEAAPQDLFFFFGYFVIPTTIWGRTPGKWVAGIVVVDSDGRTPGPAAIPREMIGRFVSAIAVGIGLVWMVFDPKRQGWHDKIAGTFVVDNPYSGGPRFIRDFIRLGSKPKDDAPATDGAQDPDQKSDKNTAPEATDDQQDDALPEKQGQGIH